MYMDLMICIRDEDDCNTEHKKVKTRTNATLHDSLCNVLDQPLEYKYRPQDPGVTWHGTIARQLKVTHTSSFIYTFNKRNAYWSNTTSISSLNIYSVCL